MNIFAITHNLKLALNNMGHDQEIIDELMDTARDGTEAVKKFT